MTALEFTLKWGWLPPIKYQNNLFTASFYWLRLDVDVTCEDFEDCLARIDDLVQAYCDKENKM